MDLATIETNKALALDALRRGALAEAEALYAELEPEYARHGADDALVGLRFNRLLVALEKGDRPAIAGLMTRLAESLWAADKPSPMVADVAGRICRLFADPFPGVDHEVTGALVAMAAERARPVAPRPADEVDPDALPTPDALARLHAGDAAVVVLDLADALRGRPGCPSWLRSVVRAFGEPAPLGEGVATALKRCARELDEGDVFHAYPTLVAAFVEACGRQPVVAAELLLGLGWLEAKGLPERLAYTPSLPRERRLVLSVELHGRLATGLGDEAGAERLAMAQWRRVLELCDDYLERAEGRQARGGGRGGDAEQEALICIWRSRAARVLGDFETAATALARSVARARRQAFATAEVAARVLREAAEIAERMGDRAAAARLYGEAAQAAAPGSTAAGDEAARGRLVEEAMEEPQRLLLAADALGGLARTGEGSEAAAALETARFVLTLARPLLEPTAFAQGVMRLELTAARRGEAAAALRALEAARAAEDRPGVALALLYRGLGAHRGRGSVDETRGVLETLASAASAARATAAGAVRRAVETGVAVVHQARADKADPARVEIHLRRAAEAAEGPALADGAGVLDVFLPDDEALDLEAAIGRLVDEGDAPLARRLCAAARRRDQRIPVSTSPGPAADTVHLALQRRFAARWLDEGPVEPMAAIRARVDDGRLAGDWSLRTPWSGEARIEFRVFDEWTAVFVVTSGGIRMHRWSLSRAELARRVEALCKHLAADEMSPFLDAATEAYRVLVEPLLYDLDGIERLVIAPDGPLVALPFELLWGGAFLAEYFDVAVARPAAPPAFSADTPLAPATALIVGDAATARDLQISTLAGEGGLRSVDARHGEALDGASLPAVLAGGRFVHLVGEVAPGPALCLVDDGNPVPVPRLAEALGAGGTVCATLMGPLDGAEGGAAVGALLAGVRGGVLGRRWAEDADRQFLLLFLARAVDATDARALTAALGAARRDAIAARLAPKAWGAYTLYVPEGI